MPAAPKSPATPAPGSAGKFGQLKAILHEMFQLDRGDLDFGLYRIMRMKADEIKSFLDDDLLPQVQEKLQGISAEKREQLENELAEAIAQARKLGGFDPEETDKVKRLRGELKESQADAEAEADVYNHLANFFSRYYSEGDFMSLRRYSSGGKAEYLIPYNGEEVKLHWANADQYYIKTTENYTSYIFAVGGERRVRFEIVTAESNKDNVKESNGKQRRFVLAKKQPITTDGNELIVRFEHRPLTDGEKRRFPGNGASQQNRINTDAEQRILNSNSLDANWRTILAAVAPTQANGERTVLAQQLERYTAKNSFDYFIHKDLGGFLRRELDLYLKNQVLNLDDLDRGNTPQLRRALARMSTTRFVAEKIITFLAQLEDFQKRLWLKKKFVFETHWCVTLNRVPEALYPEIASNKLQCDEWIRLFSIDKITSDLANGSAKWSMPPSIAFLKAYPYLVLDTKYFARDFTDRLLAALSDTGPLWKQSNGLLVHGENFQALNLLQARYRDKVRCIYIDPPYNSRSSEIAYKNDYKHSSWITLLENRLHAAESLRSSDDGVISIAVDKHERESLGSLISQMYSEQKVFCVSIVHNKGGTQGKLLSINNDYAYFVIPETKGELNKIPIPKSEWSYLNFRKWGGESLRTTARDCFYPIFVRDEKITGFGDVCPDDFHPESSNIPQGDGTIAVYPIDAAGDERKWRYARASVHKIQDLLKIKTDDSEIVQIFKAQSEAQLKTVWASSRHIAGDHGTKLLTDLGLPKESFDYPKSLHTVYDTVYAVGDATSIVLDYFAGSGTTGHAVVDLNRDDDGNRKYILIEVGNHFNTALLPRMKKIVHARKWRNGRPLTRDGVSQFFQYVQLESYEDTLDALEIIPLSEKNTERLFDGAALREDYKLRYALQQESSQSTCLLGKNFTNPFSYTLQIVHDGTRKEVHVDLPETFNFLLGLQLESRRRLDEILTIVGVDSKGKKCMILWRDINKIDNTNLEEWIQQNRAQIPEALALLYVNGDHTLNAVRKAGETWIAKTIEPVFRELMFEGTDHEE